jgi:hypothetical protein
MAYSRGKGDWHTHRLFWPEESGVKIAFEVLNLSLPKTPICMKLLNL